MWPTTDARCRHGGRISLAGNVTLRVCSLPSFEHEENAGEAARKPADPPWIIASYLKTPSAVRG